MKYYVIIPAFNEADCIGQMLQSLVQQTVLPAKAIVVNDNSTDSTEQITNKYAKKNEWLSISNKKSDAIHIPGSKVIEAFYTGYNTLNEDYDIIVKLDADLILPSNYFETILKTFSENNKAGIVGGFAYIKNDEDEWILENLTGKDHIRGAFKAYRRDCFMQIGKLKPAMGWDTVDELLAKFYKWEVITVPSLKVKHLKPTGASYSASARYKQGEAFYTLGYGLPITGIAGLKLAIRKKKPLLFIDYIKGYFRAKKAGKALLVTNEQAEFIRNYRLKKMWEKLF